eukprot:158829_1
MTLFPKNITWTSIGITVVLGAFVVMGLNYYGKKRREEKEAKEKQKEQDAKEKEEKAKKEREEKEKEEKEIKQKKWKKIDDYFNYARPEIAKYISSLIEKNEIEINETDPKHSYTLLMWSSLYGAYRLSKLMITFKADINLKNQHNQTALDIAKEYKKYNIIELLINNGANDKNPVIINEINKFDISSKDYEKFNISFDGITINKKPNSIQSMYTCACFASSKGWNEGINQFKVECIKPGRAAIGIITDIQHCKQLNSWFSKIDNKKEAVYCFLGGNGMFRYYEGKKYESFPSKDAMFKEGDIIRVVIDCNQWKLYVYINGVCESNQDIVQDKTYYPMINLQSLGYETCYKLI